MFAVCGHFPAESRQAHTGSKATSLDLSVKLLDLPLGTVGLRVIVAERKRWLFTLQSLATHFFSITISSDVMEANLYSNKNFNWVKKKICCAREVTLEDGVVLWHQGTKFVCLQTPVIQFQWHLPNVNVPNVMPIYT